VSPGSRGRQWGRVILALGVFGVAASEAFAESFGFDDVTAIAEKRAAAEFHAPERVPDWLLKIGYDQWRDIRFRPEESLFRKVGPFEVQFWLRPQIPGSFACASPPASAAEAAKGRRMVKKPRASERLVKTGRR